MAGGLKVVGGLVALVALGASVAEAAEPMGRDTLQVGLKEAALQQAAPTRYFEVEKAKTLAPGENRFGGSVQVGGLGFGALAPTIAGGLNVRADANVRPGLEAGISATGLGAAGVSNLFADVGVRGKVELGDLRVGGLPVAVAASGLVGGFLSGGGLTSGSAGFGFPVTVALSPGFNVTLAPGIGLGFASANPPLGQPQTSGFTPAMGFGADLAVTDRLSALIDARLGWGGGATSIGNLGVRYGLAEDWAADLFVGYRGNPLMGGLNAGTLGLGGYYAF
ncbi:MAG: hypothetical protein VKQ33_02560 [Candidatus Sericytochromatia bacterium]|nr:hypothetical protein [Candidatus Sericytochromatia bacterium]